MPSKLVLSVCTIEPVLSTSATVASRRGLTPLGVWVQIRPLIDAPAALAEVAGTTRPVMARANAAMIAAIRERRGRVASGMVSFPSRDDG